MNNKKTSPALVNWILAVFMLLASAAFMFSFASILFALLGIALLPVKPIRKVIDRFIPQKKALRILIVVAVFILGCCVTPQDTEPSSDPTPTDPSISALATEPSAPATEPSAPATEPSAPATEPSAPATEPSAPNDNQKKDDYILNTDSKVFHRPSCYHAKRISDANRKDFHGTREELIGEGYTACKTCKP